MARAWRTDRWLSSFLAILIIVIFVVPPLVAAGRSRSLVMDIVFALLLISGVLALAERWFARRVLMPVAVATIAIHFASWLIPIARTIVEIASLVSLVL